MQKTGKRNVGFAVFVAGLSLASSAKIMSLVDSLPSFSEERIYVDDSYKISDTLEGNPFTYEIDGEKFQICIVDEEAKDAPDTIKVVKEITMIESGNSSWLCEYKDDL